MLPQQQQTDLTRFRQNYLRRGNNNIWFCINVIFKNLQRICRFVHWKIFTHKKLEIGCKFLAEVDFKQIDSIRKYQTTQIFLRKIVIFYDEKWKSPLKRVWINSEKGWIKNKEIHMIIPAFIYWLCF